jgi:hypothetical protein
MQWRKNAAGLHPAKQAASARAAFLGFYGACAAETRQAQLDALPVVVWKGKTLHALCCTGTTGRGPHVVNVPASLVWSLIDLRAYRCPYHG